MPGLATEDDCFARRDVAELTIELATFEAFVGPGAGRALHHASDRGSCLE